MHDVKASTDGEGARESERVTVDVTSRWAGWRRECVEGEPLDLPDLCVRLVCVCGVVGWGVCGWVGGVGWWVGVGGWVGVGVGGWVGWVGWGGVGWGVGGGGTVPCNSTV